MQLQPNTTLAQSAPRDGSDQTPAAPNALSTMLVVVVLVASYFALETAVRLRRRARG